MKERFPFKEGFEPVVNVGENLCLLPIKDEDTGLKYVKVLYIESLPFYAHDFGVVGVGESAETSFAELHMDDNELGHFRLVPLVDDLIITHLAQPKAQRRWVTKNTSWESLYELADPRNNPMMEKYHLNEIFQHEDDGLWVRVTSVAGVAAGDHLGCYGFRYVFERLSRKPTVFTPIPVQGYRAVVKV